MTRGLLELAAFLLLAAGAVWAYGEHAERMGEERAKRQALQGKVARAEAARASVDSAARLRVRTLTASIDSLEREAAHLDTVVEVRTVTLRNLVPDSVKPAVDSLVAACDARQRACERAKDSLRSVVLTREEQLAATDSLLDARKALISELQDQLDPPFWRDLMGDLPSTIGKVGAGVILGAVLAQ